ncbi:MAG: AAA family ATPase [Bacteroides graminisolvens]|jgi:AAA+ ATPase superfamily predicted ATPase|uniref:AAA family ATPase n=1 Tax=Bacteroides graminisolvens TaxID=477666 RepID=UPI002409239D|nr:ATP-binding protein [Bacteroides graminisolvens]HPW72224.1 ATP-binding protein [Bacteroides graminisolvens]
MESKPFIFGVATSGDNFTDREKETARLLSNFQHGVNTVLISPRRWGKTSLVQKVCRLTQSDKLKIVYLDIFSCRSDGDFYNAFAAAVLKQTSSKWDEWVENAKLFLSRISPRISLGPDPMSDFSISLELNPKSDDIDEILQLPEKIAQKKGINIVVCIDEFQQIAEFKDSKMFQKRLRSVWQLQKSVSYCLFGSKMHLMNELFEKRNLPFYKFGDAVYLPKISTSDWVEYICGRFEATGKHISKELAEKICRTVDNHSSYVQQLAWLVWIQTKEVATDQNFEDAFQDIVDQNTPLFEKQTESLTTYQMNFLRAIVNGVHKEFTTQEVLQKYQLGSSANVSTVKRALIKKELIETEKQQVIIPDPVMRIWLKREFEQ